MQSLRHLYRIGRGPSSSHTIGPQRAAERFRRRFPDAAAYRVALYGALAATGRGHLTDRVLREIFAPQPVTFTWHADEELPEHPVGMRLAAVDEADKTIGESEAYSIGGGALLDDPELSAEPTYPDRTMKDIVDHCEQHGRNLWEYVEKHEEADVWPWLDEIWEAMVRSIERGLRAEGVLPGGLGVPRKAATILRRGKLMNHDLRRSAELAAYAYAVSEENANAQIVVTAPTCGACGVVPAVLKHLSALHQCDRRAVHHALATAGILGNLIKHNASISGAEVGCQGEVGAACAMAAGAATQLLGGSPSQIEYAAEMALEHHLGLTCDPVGGLVQIPCIERNVYAASRAISCAHLAMLSDGRHRIPFDAAVSVMDEVGRAMPRVYRETSIGGLAKIYRMTIEHAPIHEQPAGDE